MGNAQNSFITNQDKFLSEIIDGILPKSNNVDILVGYFYYSGFEQICNGLKDQKIRILVGLDVDTLISNKIREVDNFVKNNQSRGQIKDRYYSSLVSLVNETDSIDSERKQNAFRLFYSKIIDGSLEIRKTEEPCHAKMYLFDYKDIVNEGGEAPGTVITGSSNLSYSGLKGRLEINARFSDKQSFMDGKSIFNDLWETSISIADKDTLEEFKDKVIKHIWYEKLHRPYLMYIRVLNEYFSIPTKENLLTPHDITNGKFYNLKYQTDATQMAINAIETHNGVIVADVVGLGKSIIAATVARNLKFRTIIVCPPHLKFQWEEYKDEFGFAASVFSSGQIEAALSHYKSISNKGEQFLIIVDEAHKYRNEYTKDYANLHILCSDNKVMLLTATPFNNRPDDIYSMLKLFQIPTKSTLKTVDNLGAAFKELIDKYKQLTKDQREGKTTDEEVKSEARKIAKIIRSIISPLVVRRSRLDLNEIPEYKKDLANQKIKTVIPNDPELLDYDLGNLRELYLKTLDRIDSKDKEDGVYRFKAARYAPITYVTEKQKEALTKELEKKMDISFNLLVGRQSNISNFMRKLLVRRFESSVASFKSSLEYMIKSSENVLKWIEKSNKVPVYKKGDLPNVDDFYISTDDGLVEVQEKFDKYTERGFFEIDMKYINDDFVKDVKTDVQLLKTISQEWFGVNGVISTDPKLNSFVKILKDKELNDPKRKIIVFTEFADTANYLGERLQNTGLKVLKYTSADASPHNKETIRVNFDAGLKQELQCNDYNILIATDAISEGYNLHRAGAIFNYDIPYNPTRVIQRIGRINRINKKMFDELYIYNYFPTDVGESETRTKEISTLKMAMIHAIMGEDTKALTKDEELQAFFTERYKQEFRQSEEVSWDNKYRKLLNELKGTEVYNEALNIQHRSRIGRNTEKPLSGVLMFGKKGNDFVFKLGDSATNAPTALTAEEAISLFEAFEDEEAFKTSNLFDKLYQNAKSHLFKGLQQDRNEKERLNAMAKIKLVRQSGVVPMDYLEDLIKVIESDGLSGYELRYINQLTAKDYVKLPKNIEQSYLNRTISRVNKVDEGEEVLILAEELLKKER
ncbi:MAG: helicase [Bacteroides sp.]|nr:helicase-related protein [Bacteroides sp.]MBP8622084.1 helicase [Bacteroides sp.]